MFIKTMSMQYLICSFISYSVNFFIGEILNVSNLAVSHDIHWLVLQQIGLVIFYQRNCSLLFFSFELTYGKLILY